MGLALKKLFLFRGFPLGIRKRKSFKAKQRLFEDKKDFKN